MSYEEIIRPADSLESLIHLNRRSKEAISPNHVLWKKTPQFIPCQPPYPTNFNHWPEPMKRRFCESLEPGRNKRNATQTSGL